MKGRRRGSRRRENRARAGAATGRDSRQRRRSRSSSRRPASLSAETRSRPAASMPEVSTQSRAIRAAAIETKITRRYCMKATRRASAPKASAISTMAVAPPGAEPQTAVESRQDLAAADEPAKEARRRERRHDSAGEKQPIVEEGREDPGEIDAGDKAADDRLALRRSQAAAHGPSRRWCPRRLPPASARSAARRAALASSSAPAKSTETSSSDAHCARPCHRLEALAVEGQARGVRMPRS